MSENQYDADLPGVPDVITEDESDDESEEYAVVAGESDPEKDESPYEKLYVAVDGITAEELSEAELEALRQEVCDFMLLKLQKPITGVRVLSDEANVLVQHNND